MNYKEFQQNLMTAILMYRIINIYTEDGEKIVIGDAGIKKQLIHFRPFGFYVKEHNSAKWYSYAHIKQIEVFGHEF